ncbi:MAG: hypothetical protein E7554_02865 [Ruminococcaceae bacterium]|nr:hypothetical protein [Oscillospiraceae bacterium]
MNGYIRRLIVLLMCVALVISTPVSAMASAVLPEPEVGAAEDSVINADDKAEASTSVDILVTGQLEIIGQTDDCRIDEGDDLELQVVVSGVDPFKYTWEVSEDGGITWKTPDGATDSPKYQITDAAPNRSGGEALPYIYRVTVEDRLGQTASTEIEVEVRDGFAYRRILDEGDKVAVSAMMYASTTLYAEPISEGNSAYDDMYRNLAPGCLPLNAVDLALQNKEMDDGFFEGEQKVEFLVGDEYEGQTLRVFQMLDGKVVEHSAVVQDGVLTIFVDRLSQFMVEAPSDEACVVDIITGEGGTASPNGQYNVREGDDLKVVFLPDDGYVVDKVLLDGVEVKTDANSYTLEDISGDHTLEVTFKESEHSRQSHLVSVTVGSGKGSASPRYLYPVRHGDSVVINLLPASGYAVRNVVVEGIGEYEVVGNYLTFPSVTRCLWVTVNFEKVKDEPVQVARTITTSAGEGGTISPAGENSVGYGGDLYCYIIPDEGYVIDQVTVDGKVVTVKNNTYHFINVVDNHTIHATFKPGTSGDNGVFYTINAVSGSHGSISPAGKQTVPKGGSQTFHFTPDSGYVVKAVYVNGKLVSTKGFSYTVRDVSRDTTIRVEFTPAGMVPTGDITPDTDMTWCWILLGAASGIAVLMLILIIVRRKKDDDDTAGESGDKDGHTLS